MTNWIYLAFVLAWIIGTVRFHCEISKSGEIIVKGHVLNVWQKWLLSAAWPSFVCSLCVLAIHFEVNVPPLVILGYMWLAFAFKLLEESGARPMSFGKLVFRGWWKLPYVLCFSGACVASVAFIIYISIRIVITYALS
jgi:hypothetical protein